MATTILDHLYSFMLCDNGCVIDVMTGIEIPKIDLTMFNLEPLGQGGYALVRKGDTV